MLVPVKIREHGPAIALSRGFSHSFFENLTHLGVFLRRETLNVSERSQYGFMRRESGVFSLTQHLAHAVRQNAILIGHGGDNPRNQLVLQLEDRLRIESTLVSLRPEVRTGNCVRELDC